MQEGIKLLVSSNLLAAFKALCEAKTDRSRTRSPRSFQLSKVGDSSSKRLKIKFGVYGLPEKHCLEDVGAYCYILNIR